jgi:hypothetical protein
MRTACDNVEMLATSATNSVFNLEEERVGVPYVISDKCMQIAAASYECETWPFSRSEKCTFGISEIKMLRRIPGYPRRSGR